MSAVSTHKKHADIVRPSLGNFGRFEVALIGAPCDVIKSVVVEITKELKGKNQVTYVDADHHAADRPAYTNMTDRISHDRIDYARSLNDFDKKLLLNESDLLLINGNHFIAQRQIVFCTEKKKLSLEKKLDRLTDVVLIILDTGIEVPHAFLKSTLSNYEDIEVVSINDVNNICKKITGLYEEQLSPINGLVLGGGRSQRMGQNKAVLDYHGMPQVEYVCQQMLKINVQPLISCRKEQDDLFNDRHPKLYDTFEGLGPFGGILSAFKRNPNVAWLVMACDQPLITSAHLKYLIDHRDPSKMATCYHNPETGFPEPILTLWEPKAYQRLLQFLSLGYSCPRKVLINSEINELKVDDTMFMRNANTPEERKELLSLLSKV